MRLGYTPKHICKVFQDKSPISADMAIRLEFVLRKPANHWMRLQCAFDLKKARKKFRGRKK